ncbi:MAG TPA: GNAT family N-acetyltransferase [Nocardioides sp.]|nr:GNAT family N-acetyltransferase [Nocardioides sp.]
MASLVRYDGSCAAHVVDWCAASPFSSEWVPGGAGDPDAVLAGWLEDPDITGYLLLRAGTPVAYGELWVEPGDAEAELAHLVVDPALRRQGLGTSLTRSLVDRARDGGLTDIFLRVHAGNAVAIACYAGVGFARCSPEEEVEFNAGQPASYRWMRHVGDEAPAVDDGWMTPS